MNLVDALAEQPFQGYAYAYPHKMAYRHIEPPIPLAPIWSDEKRDALFLYVHIPFCEMRCGFCNLFTTTGAGPSQVDACLEAIERQMAVMADVLGSHRFARAAFGGGTPTFLSEHEIARLFASIHRLLSPLGRGTPISFEMSPATVTPEKMRLLVDLGVTRASLGVQSFLPEETRALGRPQKPAEVVRALDCIKSAGFPITNIDLIYGAQNQTRDSWRHSLDAAMRHEPEEVYLYPLYVRPLTGLDRLHRQASDLRLELYREGRDYLLARGYRQISMRLFRRTGTEIDPGEGPVYCCQEDGMLGLGPGARSYTRSLHYSSEYAVGRNGIQEIIHHFTTRTPEEFAVADYGCILDLEEQRRRYIIKSLLRSSGLDGVSYASQFGAGPGEHYPALNELLAQGLARENDGVMQLTEPGMERSDTIGPWLFSESMRSRMQEYELV
jgi:oxygen-independent coproporphyrinogen III oxidase